MQSTFGEGRGLQGDLYASPPPKKCLICLLIFVNDNIPVRSHHLLLPEILYTPPPPHNNLINSTYSD